LHVPGSLIRWIDVDERSCFVFDGTTRLLAGASDDDCQVMDYKLICNARVTALKEWCDREGQGWVRNPTKADKAIYGGKVTANVRRLRGVETSSLQSIKRYTCVLGYAVCPSGGTGCDVTGCRCSHFACCVQFSTGFGDPPSIIDMVSGGSHIPAGTLLSTAPVILDSLSQTIWFSPQVGWWRLSMALITNYDTTFGCALLDGLEYIETGAFNVPELSDAHVATNDSFTIFWYTSFFSINNVPGELVCESGNLRNVEPVVHDAAVCNPFAKKRRIRWASW
jgi:hypothetical protein